MLKTNVLCAFKGLFPPIHQPLPLTKHESQQLLKALTTSFRKNLDREYGGLQEETLTSAPSRTSPALSGSKDRYRPPADRHLRAILSNPLFSYDNGSGKAAVSQGGSRDPMDVFDEAVAKGMMTVKRASGCLLAVKRDIVQSPTMSMTESMAASGAGLRVVRWLRSSGQERDLAFISNMGFTNTLLGFMVAEGLDDVAWSWLERLARGEGPPMIKGVPSAALVLKSLVVAKSHGSASLDEAYTSILQAEQLFQSSQDFTTNLLMAWRNLSWRSTVEAWKRPAPSEALFDSYVAIADHTHRPLRLDRAHLGLHHPTRPTSSLAIAYLQDEPSWKKRLLPPATDPRPALSRNQLSDFAARFMSLGLDTVQHLTRRGQAEEAQWVLFLLQSHLGPQFATYKPLWID